MIQVISSLDIYKVMIPAVQMIWLRQLQKIVNFEFLKPAFLLSIFNTQEEFSDQDSISQEGKTHTYDKSFLKNISWFFIIFGSVVLKFGVLKLLQILLRKTQFVNLKTKVSDYLKV